MMGWGFCWGRESHIHLQGLNHVHRKGFVRIIEIFARGRHPYTQIQLNLEQHGFELWGVHPWGIFSINTWDCHPRFNHLRMWNPPMERTACSVDSWGWSDITGVGRPSAMRCYRVNCTPPGNTRPPVGCISESFTVTLSIWDGPGCGLVPLSQKGRPGCHRAGLLGNWRSAQTPKRNL